jgi:hypothetical protein
MTTEDMQSNDDWSPTVECAVCADEIDVREETHFSLTEEPRPIPDGDEMEFGDFFSKNWLICWPCVWTKLNISGSEEDDKSVVRSATAEEIDEWNENNEDPHPVFEVPFTPTREPLRDADDESSE